jgi:hypothetical protein
MRWQSGGKLKPTRVAFISTHPIQYFAPLYADLNRAEDLSVTALYLPDYSIRGATDYGFEHVVNGMSIYWRAMTRAS